MQHQSCVTDECHQDMMLIISISFLEIYVRRINDDDFVTLLFLFRREIYARRKLLPHDVIDNIARTNNNPLLLTGSIVSSRWFVLFFLVVEKENLN